MKNDQRKHVWRMVAVLASLPAMLALAVLLLGVLDAPEEWAVVALHVVLVLWVLAYSLVFAGVARYVWGKLVGTTDIRRGARHSAVPTATHSGESNQMTEDFIASDMQGYSGSPLTGGNSDYVRRYWLMRDALAHDWAGPLSSAFSIDQHRVSIREGRGVEKALGGVLFDADEFVEFQKAANASGAQRFAVIEDVGQQQWERIDRADFHRYAFPVSITWRELACSCDVATDVFQRPIRAYFVVTDNGLVGKYADADAEEPYELRFGVPGVA